MRLYNRSIYDNGVTGTWGPGLTGTLLTPLDIPANTAFQYNTQTLALDNIGITGASSRITQFELTRAAADPADTLVGDYDLIELNVTFS